MRAIRAWYDSCQDRTVPGGQRENIMQVGDKYQATGTAAFVISLLEKIKSYGYSTRL